MKDSSSPQGSVRVFTGGSTTPTVHTIDEITDLLADSSNTIWVDLDSDSREQLHRLAPILGIHDLAVGDALGPHQRPKLDTYPGHLFLACHDVNLDVVTGTMTVEEIDTLIGERWIVTVRSGPAINTDAIIDRCSIVPHNGHGTAAFIVYAMLDQLLESYFDTIETFDDYYDDVAEEIFSEHPLEPQEQHHWFLMRQSLIRFHRLAFPLREAIAALMRDVHGLNSPTIQPYFQDLYDHVLRISESTDSLRDLVSTIVETNLSLRDYRQNQIMKKATSWAAIVAIPTLVTGFYGMNVKFPSESTTWGTWVAVALMVVTSVALYMQFKRRDWL
ncbi:MAG: magnesium transporter CorA family protein [Microthrixaceae bacterium]|nr:magnesium transporter CorA family protein [Microthrixaceae bacterium]